MIASEPMDEDPGLAPLEPGELLHVDGDLNVISAVLFQRPPARQLSLYDLTGNAASSQAEQTARG